MYHSAKVHTIKCYWEKIISYSLAVSLKECMIQNVNHILPLPSFNPDEYLQIILTYSKNSAEWNDDAGYETVIKRKTESFKERRRGWTDLQKSQPLRFYIVGRIGYYYYGQGVRLQKRRSPLISWEINISEEAFTGASWRTLMLTRALGKLHDWSATQGDCPSEAALSTVYTTVCRVREMSCICRHLFQAIATLISAVGGCWCTAHYQMRSI